MQIFFEKFARALENIDRLIALSFGLVVDFFIRRLRQFDVELFGQLTDRLNKGLSLSHFEITKNVAASLASEAIEKIIAGIDVEGRRFFAVTGQGAARFESVRAFDKLRIAS